MKNPLVREDFSVLGFLSIDFFKKFSQDADMSQMILSILPNSLPNWLAFILVAAMLAVLFRKLHLDDKMENHSAPKTENADHVEHLPI